MLTCLDIRYDQIGFLSVDFEADSFGSLTAAHWLCGCVGERCFGKGSGQRPEDRMIIWTLNSMSIFCKLIAQSVYVYIQSIVFAVFFDSYNVGAISVSKKEKKL